MATKSFYKDVVINNKADCRNLVSALEKAVKKKGKDITVSGKVSTVKKNQLKEFFSNS